ncbi:MAG: hypothetical protein ACLFOY_05660 [Desulfatibacillaceae bacterium]
MKTTGFGLVVALVLLLALPATSLAISGSAEDITKETIVGPGSVDVQTGKDILMSFGATVRMIPTMESDWDFGMSRQVPGYFLVFPPAPNAGYQAGNGFLKYHANEGGWFNDNYIRNEDKLYFNALPKDRKWSFYAALEFDSGLETQSVDVRGGKDSEHSSFGLERLHCTYELPKNMRFHAGWDVWHVDAVEGAGMVYGDDNPGFWLTGDYMDEALGFNVGYFKIMENDFQSGPNQAPADPSDRDRDLLAGYLTMHFDKSADSTNKFQLFYTYDRIRNVGLGDFPGKVVDPAFGIAGAATGTVPETDSHHLGFYYLMNYFDFEFFFEYAYQFGVADEVNLAHNEYDISAHAFAGDVSYDFREFAGFSFKPHVGFVYTSGDDDPTDDELNGYNGNVNAQRFSQRWGGENTIIGDTNLVLGTMLYGYVPELYGNGTPVFTGGLQNTAELGGGRGDNPGMTMISAGVRMAPKKYLMYNMNVNFFWWNENFNVINHVSPIDPATGQLDVTEVGDGHVGTEWDNEVTLALSPNTFVKGQFSWFFSGEGITDVTEALGGRADDTAQRLAMEFIWNF